MNNVNPPPAPLVEPLTRREREILALLDEDLSNQEIALKLSLALSSTKWHIQQIYGKLGVNNRRQALARAGKLGLLRSESPAPLASKLPESHSGQPLPTGTVTFLFTDIEGSTPLWEQKPREMKAAVARHHAILRQAIESHQGHVFKIVGDSFQGAFAQAGQALSAALEAQRVLLSEVWGDTGPLGVRMGLHTGPAEMDGDDYAVSHTLNRVARIMSAGHGSQVLVSLATAELLRGQLPGDVTLQDLGEHHLKGMLQPERIFQVVAPGLPVEFPALNSLTRPKHNLPAQLTSFIGRKNEAHTICQLLEQHRLVTLTGSGGVGKTRLALEVGSSLLKTFSNGVWLVELAHVTDPGLAPSTVARILGLRETPGLSVTALLADFLQKKSLLLILDNCEQVVEACARLVDALLKNCSSLHILATSREILGLAGEMCLRVPPLSLPDPQATFQVDQLAQYEAVRLFTERCKQAAPDFTLTEANAPFVARICQRLDGIPLAIELATARARMLSIEGIASRLDNAFHLLTSGSRAVLPRHQTLKALIDWSYNLLSERERRLLLRLSVFAGGWSLESAEAVCADEPDGCMPAEEILDLLCSLVDKSLVIPAPDRQGVESRYRMLETIRQYAHDRLVETSEHEAVCNRHLDYFLRMSEQAAPRLHSAEQITWFPRLDIEHENLQAALEWAKAADAEAGLRLASALWYYWYIRAIWGEGRQWLERVLEVPSIDSPTYPKRKAFALACLAYLLIYMEEMELAQERIDEGLELSQKLDNLDVLAFALKVQEYLFRKTDKFAEAEPLAKKSVEIYRRLDQPWGIAGGLYALGVIADMYWHDTTRAHQYYIESLHWYRKSGDRRGCAYALNNLGNLAYKSGDFETAKANYQECLSLSIELGDRLGTVIWLNNLGLLELQLGNFDQAKGYIQEGIPIARAIGHGWGIASMLTTLGDVNRYEGDLDQAYQKYEEGLTLSRQLSEQMLIACALRGMGEIELARGRLSLAENNQREALAILQKAPNFYEEIPSTFEALGAVSLAQERWERAVRLYGAAQALRRSLPRARTAIEQKEFDSNRARLQRFLGEAAFSTAWEEGQAMSMDEAVKFALSIGLEAG